ncbi:phosphate acetyltransferase [Kordiimonas sp. SCSIO 12610]|uniref:phosphate acetyltransferase n=1 Tax=Kordiimonas sp. SCSIO 12610 TaxID=2829597 RepID=UPI002109D071|nr:phosphate acetyltransferase [Kordiimonas sp. SCSIO 12610]UTW54630.1 phosphate acetyltransferase [Kordiimonas sp. SCSIO 12610]
MAQFSSVIEKAMASRKKIVFPEAKDERILDAVIRAKYESLCEPVLIGDVDEIYRLLRIKGFKGEIEIVDSSRHCSGNAEKLSAAYFKLRKHKGVTMEGAIAAIRDPLICAALMVHLGMVDGGVAGAVYTTSQTVKTILQIIGCSPEYTFVSSFFLMVMDQPHHSRHETVMFSDCGLVIDPDAEALAQIAYSGSNSYLALFDENPVTGFLSFSTCGSASHAKVHEIKKAIELAKKVAPGKILPDELQFDAAFAPEVAARKIPNHSSSDTVNIFVFPNLEAGNIGYKIAERIGGAKAIGPILQGLQQPFNDLSRGCNVDDIFNAVAVTCVQAQSRN